MLQEFTSFIKSAHSMSLRSNEFGPPSEVCTQDSERLAVIEAMAGDFFTKIQSAMRTVTGETPRISSATSMPFDDTIQFNYGLYQTKTDSLFPYRPSPFSSPAVELAFLHPSSHQIDICWQAYLKNVDQIMKVLHTPSSEEILQKAKSSTASLANGHYALVFTIYLSSILSMTPEDVKSCFNTSKTEVLTTYGAATELALARANVLRTEDIDTLQAFVLFLSISILMNETKFAWALTGLARRLICSMSTNLPPFAKEIPKRLWWQLWYLDRRAEEDHGEIPSSYDAVMNPELPLNINDSDLDPKMVEGPRQHNDWIEMSFFLIRSEIAGTSHKLVFCELGR
ncbi:hypothetical protein GX50_04398 [[Emmonsia] crescens]|uniref:Xylanolytic transcriptional activator regulatory domain-containing protein n=1 Tax=[Emmonsia] crescens TaxID=73230 RepID=A0A2B7ZIZ7_9EURO|nr:hypothetical protein GX50_04398 [Emmonsia crescens]